MDVYSRRIVGYHLADNMRAENNLLALQMALALRGINNYHQSLIHHSDKGTQYASDAYTEELEKYEIRISMCSEVLKRTSYLHPCKILKTYWFGVLPILLYRSTHYQLVLLLSD